METKTDSLQKNEISDERERERERESEAEDIGKGLRVATKCKYQV